MRLAAEDGLSRGSPVVLIGTDCPVLSGDYVAAALEALTKHDAVLGPAEDGGYVLLGLKRVGATLFSDIPWSTAQVASLTRTRMSALGWHWRELPTLWDLDRPRDLQRYRRLVSAEEPAPARPCCRNTQESG
jgi:glycosyltransferase A (GT-A) superfamily protein (DUF2064 family)